MQAKTLRTTRILLDQLRGALSRAIAEIESALHAGDRSLAQTIYRDLVVWDRVGTHLVCPFEILLCGPPNVGKSSLLNQILGYQRAIVHDQAGTTRDLLTEESSIDGWPVRLTDSAGIRDSSDQVERVGVERAIQRSELADLQLILVDPREGWTQQHQSLFDLKPEGSLVVITKHDLDSRPIDVLLPSPVLQAKSQQVSVVSGFGMEELLSKISRLLVPIEPPAGQAILFTESQRRTLAKRMA
jgi:tRNA modification GTPase